nr:hypothetical protein [Hyphomonas sp. Mor2]
MNKALYLLFFLTLIASFFGLLFSGVSIGVSLMLVGPLTTALFTAGAFIFLLFAVVFEKEGTKPHPVRSADNHWIAEPKLQH